MFAHLYRSADTIGAREWLAAALAQAEVSNFRWHDLRHPFASRLVMAGVDIRTVQELMGHKTIGVTLRYAHLAPFINCRPSRGCVILDPSKGPQLAPELTLTIWHGCIR